MMDKGGEGVRITLERSTALSGRQPEYRLIDDAELLLVWGTPSKTNPNKAAKSFRLRVRFENKPKVAICRIDRSSAQLSPCK